MAQIFTPGPKLVEHGQHIFIYGNVRTRQVIYSLFRSLDNNDSLKQLPFLGKKTQPPALRKDFWQPLATVFFPSGPQGLEAFRQLKEFRKRHELEWELAPIRTMPRKKRGRLLQDQKANSIADLAAILAEQAKISEEHRAIESTTEKRRAEVMEKAQRRVEELKSLKAATRTEYMANRGAETQNAYREHKKALLKLKGAMKNPHDIGSYKALDALEELCETPNLTQLAEKQGKEYHPDKEEPERLTWWRPEEKLKGARMSMDGVRIEWANVLDAEFAKTWPEAVIHDTLTRGGNRQRHIAASPLHPTTVPVAEVEAVVERTQAPEPEPVVEEVQQSALGRLVSRLQFGRNANV